MRQLSKLHSRKMICNWHACHCQPTALCPPSPPQVYHYDLGRPGWAPDWLSPEVLDTLRTDNEARALLEAEVQVGAGGGGAAAGGDVLVLLWGNQAARWQR